MMNLWYESDYHWPTKWTAYTMECLLGMKYYEQTSALGDKGTPSCKPEERLQTWACKLDSTYRYFFLWSAGWFLCLFLMSQYFKTGRFPFKNYGFIAFLNILEGLEILDPYSHLGEIGWSRKTTALFSFIHSAVSHTLLFNLASSHCQYRAKKKKCHRRNQLLYNFRKGRREVNRISDMTEEETFEPSLEENSKDWDRRKHSQWGDRCKTGPRSWKIGATQAENRTSGTFSVS